MQCTKCSSTEKVKNGIVQKRQRYRCKDCGYNYTVEQKQGSRTKEMKRLALEMYLEGLGFNSIGRLLKVSHVAVQKWIRKYGKEIEEIKSDNGIAVIEMDEMHTYVGAKKTTAGFGMLLIDLGKNSSTAYLAIGERRQGKNYGR